MNRSANKRGLLGRSGRWVAVIWMSSFLIAGCGSEHRQNPETPPLSPDAVEAFATNQWASDLPTNAPLREVRPGVYEFGEITIDERQKTVTFPAEMNAGEGAMEYFLVTTWGKLHESIFQTKTEPRRIHIAMLLLGAKGAGTNAESIVGSFGQFISDPSSARLPGDEISLEVAWDDNGRETRRRAEELIFNARSRSTRGEGNWVYNGSLVWEGMFLADREGSIVSLITDPLSLINNVAPGHDDQTIWFANTNTLPPLELPVQITIRLGSRR